MSTTLAVVGMHRSGTSLAARYFQYCGVHMGEDVYPAGQGNPHGHFEDIEFLEFHRALLKDLGTWTFPTSEEEIAKPIPESFRGRASVLVHRRAAHSYWGWKDPRTSLFLDFWASIVPGLKVFILVRNPFAVVDSILRRATDPEIAAAPLIGLRSWRCYNRRLLRFISHHREQCFVAEAHQFASEGETMGRRVFDKFGIPLKPKGFSSVYSDGDLSPEYRGTGRMLVRKFPVESLRCTALYWALLSACREKSRRYPSNPS